MNRTVQLIVLWLVLLAVPFKGVAAVLMLACGPSHHGTVSSVQAEEHAGHDHGHHQGSHSDSDHADHGKQSPNSKCSACDSCCVNVVMTSSFALEVWAPPVADGRHNAGDSPVVGFFTDGPERPPRSLLA